MFVVHEVKDDNIKVNNNPKAKSEKLVATGDTSQKSIGIEKLVDTDKENYKKVELVLKAIPRPLHLFLKGLRR